MKQHRDATPSATMAARLKPLPRRHRVAHLRALMGEPALDPARARMLAALLCAEMALEDGSDRDNAGERRA